MWIRYFTDDSERKFYKSPLYLINWRQGELPNFAIVKNPFIIYSAFSFRKETIRFIWKWNKFPKLIVGDDNFLKQIGK